jgi:hypothetical protein
MSQFFQGLHTHKTLSPIEHVWDALERRVRQRVPVPNIHLLHTATEEEWDNIPQATITSLINYMQRRCDALHEANGGHTICDWFSDPHPYFKKKVSVTNRCISVFPVM